jgi:hypothetical protein
MKTKKEKRKKTKQGNKKKKTSVKGKKEKQKKPRWYYWASPLAITGSFPGACQLVTGAPNAK